MERKTRAPRTRIVVTVLGLAVAFGSPGCAGSTARDRVACPPPPTCAESAHATTPDRVESGCALGSLDALCQAFRAHYRASDDVWVSEGCGYGPNRTTEGPFAEVRLVGLRHGSNAIDGEWRDQPLLGGSVRQPASNEAVLTEHLLVARVGDRWFPLTMFTAAYERLEQTPESFEWTLEPGGTRLDWTRTRASGSRDGPYGYGETERAVLVVDRGEPKIAAIATTERWRIEVDDACVRSCQRELPPESRSQCPSRCDTTESLTRTWDARGNLVAIGPTIVARTGYAPDAGTDERPIEPAVGRRVDRCEGDACMGLCAFVPAAPDAESRSIDAILAEEGRFAWSDGTSTYTLSADHSFSLDPVGLSGRSIVGRWRRLPHDDAIVEVVGRWGWMNGISRNDDYRRMRIDVRAPRTRRGADGLYQPFFVVEGLVPITEAEYRDAMRSIPGPTPAD